MGVIEKIALPEVQRYEAYAAYLREREYSRKLERNLSRALLMLGMEYDRREIAGQPCEHIRAFIREAAL